MEVMEDHESSVANTSIRRSKQEMIQQPLILGNKAFESEWLR